MELLTKTAELVSVKQLKKHPKNPNKGDLSKIGQSIDENGFFGGVVAQKSTGYILVGNHRFESAVSKGARELPVFWADIDDDHALRILVADNRIAEFGEIDEALLREAMTHLSETIGIIGTGYSDEDFAELMKEASGGGGGGEGGGEVTNEEDSDAVKLAEELRQKWGVRDGQLWEVGSHVILCGDSTNPNDIKKVLRGRSALVISDPPYGVEIVQDKTVGHSKPVGSKKDRTGSVGDSNVVKVTQYLPVKNDDSTETAQKFVEAVKEAGIKRLILWGANYFTDFLPPSRSWIAWDKENSGDFGDGELAWTNLEKPIKIYRWLWNGFARKGPKSIEGSKRLHPTQKPVGLHELIIKDFAGEGELIFDGFGGSGPTILAAELSGHPAAVIEIEPLYVAVMLERLSEYGLEPKLIEE